MTAEDIYFVIAPVFQASHLDYVWLNQLQAIGKVVAVKGGESGYVAYDVFAMR